MIFATCDMRRADGALDSNTELTIVLFERVNE